jgi:hypothetical protein
MPEHLIDPRVDARLDRQEIFKRQSPPSCTFFIHEQVFRSPVASRPVMSEQLLHVLLATSRARCTLRLVPNSIPHGAFGGTFKLMAYAEHRPVAYAETQTASMFLEEPEDVALYRAILDRLAGLALDGGQSREFLARLASEYDPPEEGNDEHA